MVFQKTSIATLVVLVLVLVTTLLSTAIGTIGYIGARNRLRHGLQDKLDRQCEQLTTALTLAAWSIDRGQIDRIIESAMNDPDMFGIAVSVAGRDHIRSRDAAWTRQPDGEYIAPPRHLVRKLPISFGEEIIGWSTVVVSPKAMEQELKFTLGYTVAVTLVVDSALVLSLYWLLRRSVLRPIRELERFSIAMCSGDTTRHSMEGSVFQGELETLRNSLDKTARLLDRRYDALEQANARLQIELRERERASAERHKLEERLAASQRMESIGRLAGGVAHDFNNMLAVIHGNVEFLREKLPCGSSMHEEVDNILSAAYRSQEITQQLLAFSRKQTIQVKTLDLNKVVRGVEKMLFRLLGEDIKLRVYPSAEEARVSADATQLEQVLMNLCINARDAMPYGGKLDIETHVLVFGEEESEVLPGFNSGEYVLMTVSDTGVGMDATTLGQIFEPFFTTKAVGKGTGLGLATVHGIIKQHGGEILVYSEPGCGTTFRIFFPFQASAVEEEASVPPLPCRGMGERILLMEDEEILRQLVGQMLKRLGYTPLLARDINEAMVLARTEEPIQLFLTDVIMPGLNGQQAFEQVREVWPELKVLYMSGYTSDIINVHGILEESTHFIAKPFSERDLGRKIQSVLAGRF